MSPAALQNLLKAIFNDHIVLLIEKADFYVLPTADTAEKPLPAFKPAVIALEAVTKPAPLSNIVDSDKGLVLRKDTMIPAKMKI